MAKVLILLGSDSDLPATHTGVETLRSMGVSFSLRIASAHRTPDVVHEVVQQFDRDGGQVIICVAGKSAHLAGVVAALTLKPVLAVPIASEATAGFDALLSMGQMPGGIPVSTMPFGKGGFHNAALTAVQILALNDARLADRLKADREAMSAKVREADKKSRIDFHG